jgi:hypothetical protein
MKGRLLAAVLFWPLALAWGGSSKGTFFASALPFWAGREKRFQQNVALRGLNHNMLVLPSRYVDKKPWFRVSLRRLKVIPGSARQRWLIALAVPPPKPRVKPAHPFFSSGTVRFHGLAPQSGDTGEA